jgi:naphthalene 1,2-dioxygenase system ferredoxin subunit
MSMTKVEDAPAVSMEDEWYDVIDSAQIDEEDVKPAEVGGVEIAIYRINGEFFATEDRCSHGAAALSDGVVIGDVIECPLHQGRFCIRTGEPKGGPVIIPLRTFATKVQDGRVLVRIPREDDAT